MDPDLIAFLETITERIDKIEARERTLTAGIGKQDEIIELLIDNIEQLTERLDLLGTGAPKIVNRRELAAFIARAERQTGLNVVEPRPQDREFGDRSRTGRGDQE